jgi:hypothetical protein
MLGRPGLPSSDADVTSEQVEDCFRLFRGELNLIPCVECIEKVLVGFRVNPEAVNLRFGPLLG